MFIDWNGFSCIGIRSYTPKYCSDVALDSRLHGHLIAVFHVFDFFEPKSKLMSVTEEVEADTAITTLVTAALASPMISV